MPKTHKPAPADPGTSYSTLEAAKLLGTSVQTVQRWMDLGHSGGWRTPGGHRRIEPAGVDRLLRLATLSAPTRADSRADSADGDEGVSIMLVDDSPDDLEFLEAVVRKVMPGANIRAVRNGFSALMLIGREKPDVLITDIGMQGFDGLEMIRSLRDDAATANLPVLAVSGYKPEEIATRFGALPERLNVLMKPLSPAMLRDTLAQIAPALLRRAVSA